jgi:uncharacterized RDD family membrane protein YckC
MDNKKIYTAIAVVLALLFGYVLYNFVRNLIYSEMGVDSYLYMLPIIIGIVGLAIFVSSGYKKSSLLRLFMCYEVYRFPFTVLFYVRFFLRDPNDYRYNNNISWVFYLGIFITLLYAACSATGLWLLGKERTPRISYFGEGEARVGQFEPATAGKRFANYIIDRVVVIIIVLSSLRIFTVFGSFNGFRNIGDERLLFLVAELAAMLLYYLILEGIFNTSAGKCITNTTIVTDEGTRPGFGRILGRTFCRFIPFDAFSFFGAGARGWHDSIPNTYVADSIHKDELQEYEITLDAELNNQP